jgi:hypothetical protein
VSGERQAGRQASRQAGEGRDAPARRIVRFRDLAAWQRGEKWTPHRGSGHVARAVISLMAVVLACLPLGGCSPLASSRSQESVQGALDRSLRKGMTIEEAEERLRRLGAKDIQRREAAAEDEIRVCRCPDLDSGQRPATMSWSNSPPYLSIATLISYDMSVRMFFDSEGELYHWCALKYGTGM